MWKEWEKITENEKNFSHEIDVFLIKSIFAKKNLGIVELTIESSSSFMVSKIL